MNTALKYKDKRVFPRASIQTLVKVIDPKPIRQYYSQNISAGGIFLLTENPIEEETKLEIEIKLPSLNTPVRTLGEVVWKQRQHPSGFAIKFIDINETAQRVIRWEVDRFLARNDNTY